ncbi:MAG: hypothetical protein IPI37_04725 [Bacteroidales bacterium]|nr:hypothetical protein [Bacteroidales bacterium]
MTYDFGMVCRAAALTEVSSTSNFETFFPGANRLRCRFREKGARQTTLPAIRSTEAHLHCRVLWPHFSKTTRHLTE